MNDLTVSHVDSVNIRIDCDKGLAKELSDYFTFKVPGYQFMPAYRSKMWDGTIKLYNIYTQTLYAGLEDYVDVFCKERGYSFNSNSPLVPKNNKTNDEVKKFIDDLQPIANNDIIKAYDHQVDAVRHAINNNRGLLLSPTASGKSLIIYSLVRHYMNILPTDKKILIIVPTISLVTQMYEDFKEYSTADVDFDAAKECHVVFAGKNKICNDSKIIISTWQSIYKMPKKYFDNFGAVFGDECHLFKSKSLTSIMSKLSGCPYRIGTTGTLDGTQTHKLVIEGLFGPVYNVVNTNELMEKDLLAQLEIDCILLNYNEKTRNSTKKMKYFDELEWLVSNKTRNDFIANMTNKLKGNTLILFQLVEKHGKYLHQLIKDVCTEHDVYFVYGNTEAQDREKIRKLTEENDNAIIVASYGTFSTGVSIRRLHNIVFASPSKSRIRVLQSIGRQLRKSKYKDKAKLYDIGDDLSWKGWTNHTLKHFVERIKIYNKERFDYKTVKINLEGEDTDG